jgi:hypothetical protein
MILLYFNICDGFFLQGKTKTKTEILATTLVSGSGNNNNSIIISGNNISNSKNNIGNNNSNNNGNNNSNILRLFFVLHRYGPTDMRYRDSFCPGKFPESTNPIPNPDSGCERTMLRASRV